MEITPTEVETGIEIAKEAEPIVDNVAKEVAPHIEATVKVVNKEHATILQNIYNLFLTLAKKL